MFKKNPSKRNHEITIHTLRKNIHLNVRRCFNQVKSDDETIKNVSDICEKIDGLTLEEMTSKEYADDLRAYFGMHKNKLRDILYIDIFRAAILENAHLFKDKIVVDIQCGLGVLSMFCALAGAKHIYAIENSNVTQLAERIIRDNNLSDKITIIKGSVADIHLPVQTVDIMVSTFFGESLFIENALDEVLDARDKWLHPEGLIFPDRCTLYLSALNDDLRRDRSQFWQDVYKFNMSPMVGHVNSEPYLRRVKEKRIITSPCPIKHLNLYNAMKSDYRSFDTYFRLEVLRKGSIGSFFTYFDVEFTDCHKPLKLTMEPDGYGKAWSQLIFYLNFHNEIGVEAGSEVFGTFSMSAVSIDFKEIDWKIFIYHPDNLGDFRQTWTFQTR